MGGQKYQVVNLAGTEGLARVEFRPQVPNLSCNRTIVLTRTGLVLFEPMDELFVNNSASFVR